MAVRRSAVESDNRRVDVVVDYTAVAALARDAGVPVGQLLQQMKEAGASAVAVSELTLPEMARYGVTVARGEQILAMADLTELREPWRTFVAAVGRQGIEPNSTYVAWQPATVPSWAVQELQGTLRALSARVVNVGRYVVHQVPLAPEVLQEVGLGLPRDVLQQVARAGLAVAPRLVNNPGMDGAQIQARFADLAGLDVATIIFAGREVTGYPGHLRVTAAELDRLGVPFSLIEFSDQKGADSLARLTGNRAVRLHSITEREIPRLDVATAIARWVRAAKDRDVRVLYWRPLPLTAGGTAALVASSGSAGEAAGAAAGAANSVGAPGSGEEASYSVPAVADARTVAFNLEYLRSVVAGLRQVGLETGRAVPFAPLRTPLPLVLVLMLGTLSGGLLLLRHLVGPRPRLELALLVLGVLGLSALYLKGYTVLVRQGLALLAAITFPALAVVRAMAASRPEVAAAGGYGRVIRCYLGTSVLSLVGAALVVGLLADVRFMLKLSQFMGVKLHFVATPAVAFLFAIGFGLGQRPVTAADLRAAWRRLVEFLTTRIAVWHVGVGLVGLAAAALYLLRSGNEGAPVSGAEQAMRQFLENLLLARPRTKEFLVGHPALVLGLVFAGREGWQRRLAPWLFVVGAIGQLSMVNTFSHIHSPLDMSLLRTAYGLLFGLLLGLVAAAVTAWPALRRPELWLGAAGAEAGEAPRGRRAPPESA